MDTLRSRALPPVAPRTAAALQSAAGVGLTTAASASGASVVSRAVSNDIPLADHFNNRVIEINSCHRVVWPSATGAFADRTATRQQRRDRRGHLPIPPPRHPVTDS